MIYCTCTGTAVVLIWRDQDRPPGHAAQAAPKTPYRTNPCGTLSFGVLASIPLHPSGHRPALASPRPCLAQLLDLYGTYLKYGTLNNISVISNTQ